MGSRGQSRNKAPGMRRQPPNVPAKETKTPSGPPPIDVDNYDPVQQYREHARNGAGEQAFRDELNSMTEEQLHKLIKNAHLDRVGRTKRWKKDRLVEFAFDITQARATQGDVFYNYRG